MSNNAEKKLFNLLPKKILENTKPACLNQRRGLHGQDQLEKYKNLVELSIYSITTILTVCIEKCLNEYYGSYNNF